MRSGSVTGARLYNSEILKDLKSHLVYLSKAPRADICQLIRTYLTLFSDVPTRTTAVCHDIDVGDHPPIKKHAYRVNPTKCQIMRDEVKYLLENWVGCSEL